MKKTAIYCRVSSAQQVQEGDSIAAQLDALNKYVASKNDLILYDTYIDDGVSGQKFRERDELQRLLSDVQKGNINLICFTKMDRWFRSIRHYINTQEILNKYKVEWIAIWEPIYDTTTPQGRLIVNQMLSIAQFEAENTGQRIRQVQAYKVSQGEVISGITPPGYKIENKHLVPDENADDIRKIFEYYSLTGNKDATIRFSKDMNVPHTTSGFKAMLMNTKYIGYHRGNPNFCQPIIEKDLFDDVQRKLSMNVKSSQRYCYIFSGLLVCDECNAHMAGTSLSRNRQKGRVTVRQYRCQKRYNRQVNKCSNTKQIYEHLLEDYLLSNIKPLISDYVVSCENVQKPVKDNSQKIAKLSRKIDKLKELYINDLISIDEYKQDRSEIESEIELLEAENKKLPEPIDLEELKAFLTMDLDGYYRGLTNEEKRFFWRSILKEIRFDSKRNIRLVFL